MIQNILKYQNIERELRKIENEIHSCKERKLAQKAKNFLLKTEENVGKMDRRAEELVLLLGKAKKSYEKDFATIKEYEDTIKTLASEDEASYLTKKVNQIYENLKTIEREISSISKNIEDVAKDFGEFKIKYAKARKEYIQNKGAYEKIKQDKAEQIKEIKTKLTALSKKIDSVVLEKYTKKRDDRIFPVLVPVKDNMCGGCSMQISLKEMDKLKSEKIIECENCHRMIYIES